ncbi:hypothetical protein OF83DRAFT_1070695 [Amylostereum chailletii]|nr:hypothetical protein OF83DRAFT_1070695 [Amylostereum chailletii]
MRFLFVAASLALAHIARAEFVCENPTTLSTTTAGANGEVEVEYLRCSNADSIRAQSQVLRFEKRQIDVCGAPCATNCFSGSPGTGPVPGDCTVIADALLYDSQNVGALFTLDPAANTTVITMKYQSCDTFIVNQAGVPLQYCRTAWSELVNDLAQGCQAAQNAHGGNCVANDQRWFVQVQHS